MAEFPKRRIGRTSLDLGLLRHPIPAGLWQDLREAGLLHPEAPVQA